MSGVLLKEEFTLGSEVFWGSLRCFDMPWHLCFFQLLINILKVL